MKQFNLDIYQQLLPEMAFTEKVVGYLPFHWNYSHITYQADLTVAIPFDLFDKAVVGILLVDEVLGIEKIGEILGLNIIHAPEKQQYRDEAEVEILKMALDSLVEFEMVTVGDIYYSNCRLTPLGREYAAKGKKFKTKYGERFALYFDHTRENHIDAHRVVKGLNGMAEEIEDFEYFEDQAFIKEIAAFQLPQIENPKTGDSFTNARADEDQSLTYQAELIVAVVYDFASHQFRFVAFQTQTHKKLPEISDWLNEHRKEHFLRLLTALSVDSQELKSAAGFSTYLEDLVRNGQAIHDMLPTDPDKAIHLAMEMRSQADYVDWGYLWLQLDSFVGKEKEPIYLVIPMEMAGVETPILNWWKSNNRRTVFVVAGSDPMVAMLTKENAAYKDYLFAMPSKVDNCFCLWSTKEGLWEGYQVELVQIPALELPVRFPLFKKVQFHVEAMRNWVHNMQVEFAKIYLPKMLAFSQLMADEARADARCTKAKIKIYQQIGASASAFLGVEKDVHVGAWIQEIGRIREELVEEKLEKMDRRLSAELVEFRRKLTAIDEHDTTALNRLVASVKQLHEEIPEQLAELQKAAIGFQSELTTVVAEEAKRKLAKTYIVDTNVLIDDPDFLSKIDHKDNIGLNLLVIEELDRLKTREATKAKAAQAIKNVKKAFETGGKRIQKFKANLKLLPEELQTKSGDNYLLSIALGCKEKNPVLITQDQNLQNKARFLDIPVMSMQAFIASKDPLNGKARQKEKLQSKEDSSPEGKKQHKINFAGVFQNMPKESDGTVVIHDFMVAVRKRYQGFRYQDRGFEKAYQFVASMPEFVVIDGIYMKLKTK